MENTGSISNLGHAKFKCYYPQCGGNCCRNGRPGLESYEVERIRDNLEKFVPLMRPEAVKVLRSRGFLSRRLKEGKETLIVTGGWCIFAHEGCVLQKVGSVEGEKWKYKPHRCVLFPISQDGDWEWYVRQKGFKGEIWNLFCLERTQTEETPAQESLREELEYLENFWDHHTPR